MKRMPKRIDEPWARDMARRVRDAHWTLLEEVNTGRVQRICPWNKARKDTAEGEARFALMSWMDFANWLSVHPEWVEIGEMPEGADTFPISLTEAGREALSNRHLYDEEPYESGLVEPGWDALPWPTESNEAATVREGRHNG